MLLQYCVGRPEPATDPDRVDVDEWRHFQEMRVPLRQFQETIQDVDAGTACRLAEAAWHSQADLSDGPLSDEDACRQPHPDEAGRQRPPAAPPTSAPAPGTKGGRTRRPSHGGGGKAPLGSSAAVTKGGNRRGYEADQGATADRGAANALAAAPAATLRRDPARSPLLRAEWAAPVSVGRTSEPSGARPQCADHPTQTHSLIVSDRRPDR